MKTKQQIEVANWREFTAVVRSKPDKLLKRLPDFPEAVLVAGCQRSGTTMLARILTQSDGMVNYWVGNDDELDAALILSGTMPHEPGGRYCFQTTYLNDRYQEYFDHIDSTHLLWLIRSPEAVVYSMLYNWKKAALAELFQACGAAMIRGADKWRYRLKGVGGISRLRQACWSYVGKTSQLFALHQQFGSQRMCVVDYDALVLDKENILPAIYRFINLSYLPTYANHIHARSLRTNGRFAPPEKEVIRAICQPIYQQAQTYLTL